MTLQPQIDVDFINEMLFSHGKKVLDPFRLNRLDKAIKAMEKVDPIQAAAARSDYLTHINDNYLALEYLKRAISKYGYQIPFAICQIRIAYMTMLILKSLKHIMFKGLLMIVTGMLILIFLL